MTNDQRFDSYRLDGPRQDLLKLINTIADEAESEGWRRLSCELELADGYEDAMFSRTRR